MTLLMWRVCAGVTVGVGDCWPKADTLRVKSRMLAVKRRMVWRDSNIYLSLWLGVKCNYSLYRSQILYAFQPAHSLQSCCRGPCRNDRTRFSAGLSRRNLH